LTSASAGKMPLVSVLKRTIRLIRQKEQAAPPNPKTLIELVISEDYKTTHLIVNLFYYLIMVLEKIEF
jgi:hypothetical protein